jgi:hypothetical protein
MEKALFGTVSVLWPINYKKVKLIQDNLGTGGPRRSSYVVDRSTSGVSTTTNSRIYSINYKTINWMSIGRKCLKTYTHPVGFDLIL